MEAENGMHERAQSSASVESDESSTATTKTTIKTHIEQKIDENHHENNNAKNENEEEEPTLESRNPFDDEDELEDIQLGEEDGQNQLNEISENGHIEESKTKLDESKASSQINETKTIEIKNVETEVRLIFCYLIIFSSIDFA